MALPKLFERLIFHNNASPALNETNLNLLSKGVSDIDDRVIALAGNILEVVPEIKEMTENAQALIDGCTASAESASDSATAAEASAEAAADAKTDAESAANDSRRYMNSSYVHSEASKEAADQAEAWAVGTIDEEPVTSEDPQYHNNAKYYADILQPQINSVLQAVQTLADNAQAIANAAANAQAAEGSSEDSEAWATGKVDGTDVPSTAPQYENNAKYWSDLAAQYASQITSGVVFKGSILFANLPTSGMDNGDMYDIKDAFTTTSAFEEGAGIECPAGTDIIWVAEDNKWNVLTPAGVNSFNGRQGAVSPAANDYNASQIKFGTNSNVNTELGNKQPTYTADSSKWDTAPTESSTKPVTSGGVYSNTVKAVAAETAQTVGAVRLNVTKAGIAYNVDMEVGGWDSLVGKWTEEVTKNSGATSCALTNPFNSTNIDIEPFCENSNGTNIAITSMSITASTITLYFSSLSIQTKFKAKVTLNS